MKVGDVIEMAMWADGTESPEVLEQFRLDVDTAVRQFAEQNHVVMTPPYVLEKKPGEDRVPPVPDHVRGPNVRLIVAESVIVGERSKLVGSTFLSELDAVDLERLRFITRRVHYGLNPDGTKRALTDEEVDRVIEEHGPEAAADVIRLGMSSGVIH